MHIGEKMITFWLVISILVLTIMFMRYRDLAAPPILSAFIWIFVYILMIESKTGYASSEYIGCFATALIFFCVGFFIIVPNRIYPKDSVLYSVKINPVLSKPVLAFEYVATAAYALIYRNEILNRTVSIWSTLRNSEIETNYFLGVLVNAFPIISAVSLYVYFKNPDKKNRNYFLLTLPPLVMAMLTSNRTTWFYVISTFMFVIIFTKQLTNKSILKLAVIGVLAVGILFAASTLAKFTNMMTTASDAEKIQYYVDVYFESPPIAFLQWLERNSQFNYGFGKYTFRFFVALAHVLIPSLDVPNTIMEFTVVDGMRTNVYTILHWYTMDGGLIWAYIIQLFIGMMFGTVYKRVRSTNNPDRFRLVLLSMMMCIILGQFFCDQLATHISAWIQRIIWCYFCCKIMVVDIDHIVEPKRKKIRFVFGSRR